MGRARIRSLVSFSGCVVPLKVVFGCDRLEFCEADTPKGPCD